MYNGKVTILDISFWQDDDTTHQKVDFVKMKAAGADGVILRAGQNTWKDEDFLDYVSGAMSAGLPIGYYWFWDSRSPSGMNGQAGLFSSIIDTVGFPELGIWPDYEELYGGSYGGAQNFRIFVDSLVAKYPNKLVGIYTAPYYWKTKTNTSDKEWGKKFPLWIAHYEVPTPDVPPNWTSWLIHQYTSKGDGKLFGVESGNVDMNVFNGTIEQFNSYFGLEGSANPPTGGTTMKEGSLVAGITSLRIRTGPGTTYAQIDGLYAGDKAYGEIDAVSGWFHISWIIRSNGTRVDIDGWCSASSAYMTFKDYVAPEPELSVDILLKADGTVTGTWTEK